MSVLCVKAGVKTLVAVTEEVGEFERVLQLQERFVIHIISAKGQR